MRSRTHERRAQLAKKSRQRRRTSSADFWLGAWAVSAIPAGYKQTEVGVIPEDWDVSSFSEVFSVTAGGDVDPKRSQSFQDGIHCYPIYSNALTNKGLYGYCSYADHPADSLTITARGMVGAANFRDHAYTAIGRVLVLQPKNHIAGIYFAEVVNYRVKFANESTGVPQLTAPQISKYLLPVPPLAEQRAITEALSDADALIESLEQLLTKKRHLKQAAMQELLTGKKRLPGFSGQWQVKLLGSLAHIKTGSRNNEDKIEDGAYPFFVRSPNVERINTYSHECEGILVPGEGNIGNIFHYINGRFDVHQRVYAITQLSQETSGKFVYFYMAKNFGAHAMQNSVKATVDSLRLPTFQNFELTMPPTHEEQTAIAVVLSDMDAELADLETQLDKSRALKQGMMQKLLTGEIRLI
jgi:type I restriction enzyme S subunit